MATTASKSRVQQARHAMYEELILEAAESVFAAEGYDAAKVQDVAKASGLSLGTLYAVFPGKREMFQAIHQRRGMALLAQATASAAEAGTPVGTLLEGVAGYVAFMVAHPNYLRMHLVEGEVWSISGTMRSREQLDTYHEGMSGLVMAFQACMDEGLFIEDEPERMARMMTGTHQAMLAHWVESEARPPADALIRDMKAYLLRCFARPEKLEALLARHL